MAQCIKFDYTKALCQMHAFFVLHSKQLWKIAMCFLPPGLKQNQDCHICKLTLLAQSWNLICLFVKASSEASTCADSNSTSLWFKLNETEWVLMGLGRAELMHTGWGLVQSNPTDPWVAKTTFGQTKYYKTNISTTDGHIAAPCHSARDSLGITWGFPNPKRTTFVSALNQCGMQ
jgi:hypothetical protein